MLAGVEKLSARRDAEIKAEVDSRLELVVLYAVGDVTGPCAHHVRIGVSTVASYAEEMRQMRRYRSADIATRYEAFISGKGKAEVLKTALLATLGDKGFAFKSWRSATDGELSAIVGKLSATYRVRIYTQQEAAELEAKTFEDVAAKYARGE